MLIRNPKIVADGPRARHALASRYTPAELDAAVVRYGRLSTAAEALGMTPTTLANRLIRTFGLARTRSPSARASLRRLIESRGIEAVADGLGDAPPALVRMWAEKGRLPASVLRAVERLAAPDRPAPTGGRAG